MKEPDLIQRIEDELLEGELVPKRVLETLAYQVATGSVFIGALVPSMYAKELSQYVEREELKWKFPKIAASLKLLKKAGYW